MRTATKLCLGLLAVGLIAGGVAWAQGAVVRKDAVHRFMNGIQVGSSATTTAYVKGVNCLQVDNQDVPSAGAATTVSLAVTVTGIGLGDALISWMPVQDDAALDEGPLTAFIESANTVKLVYHADATGGDLAATNDYLFCWLDL